jgi:hypothetical protein
MKRRTPPPPASVQLCEWIQPDRTRCTRPAAAYVMGRHACPTHEPAGSPTCTHSLTVDGRCSYCGAKVTGHAR